MAWIHLVPVANQFFENPTTASSKKVTAFGSAGAENGLYIHLLSIDPHFFDGSRPLGRRRGNDRAPHAPHRRDHRVDGDPARLGSADVRR